MTEAENDRANEKIGATKPKVFTVPASDSFVRAVAEGILTRVGDDPLKLADYTILVPDRDTATLLRRAFLEQLGGKPSLLPHIDVPGDVDDDFLSLKISGSDILSQTLMDIPPPVTRMERQIFLANEILKIPGMSSSTQKAMKLGAELGRFIDILQRSNVELKNLSALAPEGFKDQWEKTEDFLKIITDTWPKKLQEMGKIDPEDHKTAMMQIQAAHWIQFPPKRPMLAVGFTQATPATAALLGAILQMPEGEIVLPGLDLDMNRQAWQALTPTHPQYMLRKLGETLGIAREDVAPWDAPPDNAKHARTNDVARTNLARERLLREAMLPASTAKSWNRLKSNKRGKKSANDDSVIDAAALNGMDMVVCGTTQEEAGVIALKMRETLEVAGRTAMLVTADRGLARRVSARLQEWGIGVVDGAGGMLSETSAGIYLMATAQMAAEAWAPIPFLIAMKHPLSALGEEKSVFRKHLADLEDLCLHGPRPASGVQGLKGALTAAFNRAAHRPDKALTPEQMKKDPVAIFSFIDKLQTAGAEFFEKMTSGTPQPFASILDAHIRFCENLADDDKNKGAKRIWRGDDGIKAAKFLTSLREVAKDIPPVTGHDYVDLLHGLLREIAVTPSGAPHPSLKIMTPEQAKFTKADVVIMGGLADDIWPPRPPENPWLSPDMVKAIGMPPLEESVGISAHQFVQMASSPNLLISRAIRSGDAPTVASPFAVRMTTVLKGADLLEELENKSRLLEIYKATQTPAHVTPCKMPAPKPDKKHRPKQLPVTAVEGLMRDPYSVYAKYVLGLRARPPIDASPSVAEKGNYTHAALDAFVRKYPDKLPANAYEELLKMGEETFAARMNIPSVRAFWWPRFERIAKWFVRFENERRETSRTLGTEVQGRLQIDLGGGETFTLTAIADRIDRNGEDKIEIIDYKTGAVPLQKDVELGFSPQLTLEALIAYTGGFDGIDAHDVGALQYWKLSGGRPAAEVIDVKGEVNALTEEAKEGIERLMKAFNDSKTPFLPTPRPEFAPRYQNYDHLSRADEWGRVKKVSRRKTPARRKTQRRKPGGKGRAT